MSQLSLYLLGPPRVARDDQPVDGVVPAIAYALSFDFRRAGDPRRQLLDHLRAREMLLVLDNLEHVTLARTISTWATWLSFSGQVDRSASSCQGCGTSLVPVSRRTCSPIGSGSFAVSIAQHGGADTGRKPGT